MPRYRLVNEDDEEEKWVEWELPSFPDESSTGRDQGTRLDSIYRTESSTKPAGSVTDHGDRRIEFENSFSNGADLVTPAIPRSEPSAHLSTSVPLGTVNVRVSLPGLSSPIDFPGVPINQYTCLPQHQSQRKVTTSPSREDGNSERNHQSSLDSFFPPVRNPDTAYSNADIASISSSLCIIGSLSWSRVPRLYVVCRRVGNLKVLDKLIDNGITDIWFPFSDAMLSGLLGGTSSLADFLSIQPLVFTIDEELDEIEQRGHGILGPQGHEFYRCIRFLGRGTRAIMHEIQLDQSHKLYALKSVRREADSTTRTMRAKAKAFENELTIHKRLKHRHVVDFIGSFTTIDDFGLMMPVAQVDLSRLLGIMEEEKENQPWKHHMARVLRHSFGCLSHAVSYLHSMKILHGDINPSNILLRQENIMLCDFGTSYDWSDGVSSMMEGSNIHTKTYAPPELDNDKVGRESSDIWSLGCVFLEILTVLKDKTLGDLKSLMMDEDTIMTNQSHAYSENLDIVMQWMEQLEQGGGPKNDKNPIDWIRKMLQADCSRRPSASELVNEISRSFSPSTSSDFAFCGTCCGQKGLDSLSEGVTATNDHGFETEIESVVSDAASIFSDDLPLSSASSVSSADLPDTEPNFAFEIAKALLENEELNRSVISFAAIALEDPRMERVQRKFLRAIREYAKELQRAAQSPLERIVANFVRGRYLVIGKKMETCNLEGSPPFILEELDRLIEARVSSSVKVPEYLESLSPDVEGTTGSADAGDVKRPETVAKLTDQESESDDEQSGSPSDRHSKLPHITMAKEFLLEGPPFARLLSTIHELSNWADEKQGLPLTQGGMNDHAELDASSTNEVASEISQLRLPLDMRGLSFSNLLVLKHVNISFSDKIKGLVEQYSGETWNWWPLPPRHIPLSAEHVRFQWVCRCGEKRWLDLPNIVSGLKAEDALLQLIAKQSNPATLTTNPGITNIPPPPSGSSNPALSSSTAAMSSSNSNTIRNSGRVSNPGPTIGPGQIGGRTNSPTPSSLYILFCTYRGRTLRHTQIEVSKHNDDKFFEDLRNEYKQMRGWWRYWFDPRQFDHCDFVKFTGFYVDELARICHELPIDTDYQYRPRPPGPHDDPPLVPHEFYRRFYHVRNTCLCLSKNEALARIPKRAKRFQVGLHITREDMWGLHAETRPFFWMVAVWMLVILAGGFAFWGWWMSRHPGDWQNAAVPLTATFSCMMMLLLPLNEKFKSP